MACGTISANITADCDNPVKAGLGNIAYLFNFDDWQEATLTYDGTNKNELETIVLGTNTTGFKIEQPGSNNIKAMSSKLTNDLGLTNYSHSVEFFVPKIDSASIKAIESLAKGRFVVAVITNNNQIFIYGSGTGLEMPAGELHNAYSNSGMAKIVLATNEATPEAKWVVNFVGPGGTFTSAKSSLEALIA